MLVLSRRPKEWIYFGAGGGIALEVAEIRGDKVRFGIMAPPDVIAHREEVFKAIQREGREPKGTQIWITVVEIQRDKVRVGSEAPAEISILRSELFEGDPPLGTHLILSRKWDERIVLIIPAAVVTAA